MERNSVIAKKFRAMKVGDDHVIQYLFDDLDALQLKKQFNHYLEREDFEYLEEIVAEAKLRGIKFIVKRQ